MVFWLASPSSKRVLKPHRPFYNTREVRSHIPPAYLPLAKRKRYAEDPFPPSAILFSSPTLHHYPRNEGSRHWPFVALPAMLSRRSARTRVKQLLGGLRCFQKENTPVSPFLFIEIKHRFLLSRRCSRVHIQFEELDAARFDIPPFQLSGFLSSQLEVQQLIDKTRGGYSIRPILSFIELSLPSDPATQISFPTLFSWHCRPRHRTYYFFAYLNFKMPSATYTIDELLDFRPTEDYSVVPQSLAGSSPELGNCLLYQPQVAYWVITDIS